MATPLVVPVDRLRQWWHNTKVVSKATVGALAIVGLLHVTEPLRADAAVTPAVVVKEKVVKSAGK